MSTNTSPPQPAPQPQLSGLLAEYQSPAALIQAARRVRDAGYRRWDTFSPFPVHGIDPAMGIRATRLPWVVLGAGLTGGTLALFFQWWTSTQDYPWIVSGKPFFSIPANIPITFELTVLFAALSAFFGMLLFNRLPHPSHPLDRVRRFGRVTDDRFFVYIEARDARFDADGTRALLEETSPQAAVEAVMDDPVTESNLPSAVTFVVLILGAAATVPFALTTLARESTSAVPRVHLISDMDHQAKFKAQSDNPFFEDGRSSRPQVAGTLALGELRADDHLYRGKQGNAWARAFPAQVALTEDTLRTGRVRFETFCAPCHGSDGSGQGMVHLRAKSLMEGTWVPPTDLRLETLQFKPVGELFHGISNGVRNMPGYGRQISVEDRWAIVLYLRGLQRSQAAAPAQLPPAVRGQLK